MSQGHQEARHYPVPMLWTETRLARERVNRDQANEAMLTRLAVHSLLSKNAGQEFNKRIKKLTES